MYQWQLIGIHGWAIEPVYPHPHISTNPQIGGFENSPSQVAAQWLEINENVDQARLTRYVLALNSCRKQSQSFRKIPKRVNADQTLYLQSSSGDLVYGLCYIRKPQLVKIKKIGQIMSQNM